jgi:two-component system response regulator RegX3
VTIVTLRILFLEKDPTTADLLVPSLKRSGYQVTVANSQRQATNRIRSARPDVLIVDVASFGVSGYSISDTVRGRLDGVATILLLAKGHKAAGSTAEAFITPPFTSRKLLYRVRKIGDALLSRLLRAGELQLDPDSRTLRKGREVLQLRPKETDLLALFMRNRGKVLHRRQIMNVVWETDYMGDTRTLNVHIHSVRGKIEDDPSSPRYLRTVRGVGYRFDVPD